ncbi:putative CHAP-domain endopeptidase [Rhodococcus phage P19]|nr:putative CHAP-domain endopeptidase [Rhodococcus phage P19]
MDTEPAVQEALAHLGAEYVWGATGPDTFDCSGLVQYAFKKAGFDMTRTTYTQVLQGDPVTGAPQRGDLVFPDAGHVGIALGGDQMVHAPQTGDVVKISNYWTTPFAVRRMGPNSGMVGDTTVSNMYHAVGGPPSLSNMIPGLGTVQSQIDNLNNAVEQSTSVLGNISDVTKAVSMFLNILMSEQGWLRISKVILGTVAVLIGTGLLMKDFVGEVM